MDFKRKIFVVFGASAVIVTATFSGAALFFADPNRESVNQSVALQTPTSQPSDSSGAAPTAPSTAATGSSFKDGTYSATSSYFVPHGNENAIKTRLTVSNGTVTDVSVSDDYSDGTSAEFVDWFEQELKTDVVGKHLRGLSPSRIGGASLTTDAFDQTLDTIRNDAAA